MKVSASVADSSTSLTVSLGMDVSRVAEPQLELVGSVIGSSSRILVGAGSSSTVSV